MSYLDQKLIGNFSFDQSNFEKLHDDSVAKYAKQNLEFSYSFLKLENFQPSSSTFIERVFSHPVQIISCIAASLLNSPKTLFSVELKIRTFMLIRGMEKVTGLAIGILFPKIGEYMRQEAEFNLACYKVHSEQTDFDAFWCKEIAKLSNEYGWDAQAKDMIGQVPSAQLQDILCSSKWRQFCHLSRYLSSEQISSFDWQTIKEGNIGKYNAFLRSICKYKEFKIPVPEEEKEQKKEWFEERLSAMDNNFLLDLISIRCGEKGAFVNQDVFDYLPASFISELEISRLNKDLIERLIDFSDDQKERCLAFDRDELKEVILSGKFSHDYWSLIANDIIPELSNNEISRVLDGGEGREVLKEISQPVLHKMIRDGKLSKAHLKYFSLEQLKAIPMDCKKFVDPSLVCNGIDSEDEKVLRKKAIKKLLS